MPNPLEQKPGSFRPASSDETIARIRELDERGKNPPLYGDQPDFFTRGLDLTVKTFGKPRVVYYPGSGTHVGPSFTPSLEGSRIIYFDQDEHSVRRLKEAGYEAFQGDAEYFVPGDGVDLLIMLNFNHPKPPEFVRPGGYVVANNWHGAATSLKDNPDFELSGVFIEDPNTQESLLLTEDLEDYVTEFESDEEWESADESSYQIARFDVEFQNDLLPENKRVDTSNLINAIRELKKRGANVSKIAYKKHADLWIFRRKVS